MSQALKQNVAPQSGFRLRTLSLTPVAAQTKMLLYVIARTSLTVNQQESEA
jgi:hypothetical protein